MRNRRSSLALIILFFLPLACNLPFVAKTPFAFNTPVGGVPAFEAAASQTAQATPSPTATPRIWPSPYFGSPGPTQVTPVPTPFPVLSNQESVNFLLLGSDKRPNSSYRTDVIMIVSFQPAHQVVTLISVPRDLWVYVPGWQMQRINAAYQHGDLGHYPGDGPEQIKDTILFNLGIEIHHVALVDFNGFKEIIDTLGGISVPLNCSFTDWHIIDPDKDDQDEDNWELYTIGPGVVQMDGDLALWYARSRLRSSDYDRGRRQQEVMRSIYSKALQLNMLARIPELYREIGSTVDTDMGLEDVLSLITLAPNLHSARIRSYYINKDLITSWRTPQGGSVLLPNGPAIQGMLRKALGPPDDLENKKLNTFIEVWNGTNNANWDTLAIERLNYAGYEAQSAAADRNNYQQTLLYDFTTQQDQSQAIALLSVLGLSTSNLVSQPESASSISYRLIVGRDYNPCFNPAAISR